MTPSPFSAPDHCANCRGRHLCSYHEGWMDALDVARVRELHGVVEAAELWCGGDQRMLPRRVARALDDLREASP